VKGITYPTRYAVYLVTALAVTPSGARRLTQYELSRNRLSLPAPSSLTFDGPNPSFKGSSSAVFAVSGDDGCAPTTGVPALGATSTGDISNLTAGMGSRSDNYTGVPDSTGNIASGINGTSGGSDMTTVSGLKELSSYIQDNADQTFTTSTQLSGATYGSDGSPLVTVIDNGPSATSGGFTATLGPNWVGHGVILVTGDLEIKGNFSFDGLIYVIGTGHVVRDGGGNGTLNGAIFTANIDSGTSGNTPGSPYVDLTGGGSSNFQYNSCSISMNATKSAYQIVSFRELTY
jgi:hypothetical protein